MNPEQRKNHRGGARVQKPESPRREKETKREKKPGRPRTKKQKILLGLYIALTVVAAIIVAGAIVFGLMSAPPEVALPTPTPRHTTIINEQGEEVEVEIPGLSAGRKEQFYTFLVAGVSGGNTDTMLLPHRDDQLGLQPGRRRGRRRGGPEKGGGLPHRRDPRLLCIGGVGGGG